MSLREKIISEINSAKTLYSLLYTLVSYPTQLPFVYKEAQLCAVGLTRDLCTSKDVVSLPPIHFFMSRMDYTAQPVIELGALIINTYLEESTKFNKEYAFATTDVSLAGDAADEQIQQAYGAMWALLLCDPRILRDCAYRSESRHINSYAKFLNTTKYKFLNMLDPYKKNINAENQINIDSVIYDKNFLRRADLYSRFDNEYYITLANELILMALRRIQDEMGVRLCSMGLFRAEDDARYFINGVCSIMNEWVADSSHQKIHLVNQLASLINETDVSKNVRSSVITEACSISAIRDDEEIIDYLYETFKNIDIDECAIAYESSIAISALEATKKGNDDRESANVKKSSVNKSNQRSAKMQQAGDKVYKSYRKYKDEEQKIDSQLSKAVVTAGKAVSGTTNIRDEIIEGKPFSAIGILKKTLGTIAIFNYSKVGAIIALVTRHSLKKSTSIKERRNIIAELEGEIEIINEKIDDAKGDNNKQAKYALMRTKQELELALKKIKYGLEADEKTLNTAKNIISNRRGK